MSKPVNSREPASDKLAVNASRADKAAGSAFMHKWRAAVLSRDCQLSSTQKLAVLALAQFADSNGGCCFPSSSTVAECASLSEKAVQRALIVALQGGWLKRFQREAKGKDWRGQAYEYQLLIPSAEERPSLAKPEGAERESPAPNDAEDSQSNAEDCESNAGVRGSDDLAFDLVHYPEERRAEHKKKQELDASRPNDPIFGEALSFLMSKAVSEKSARSILGKVKREVGDVRCLELIDEARKRDVTDPVPWLMAAMRRRNKVSETSIRASFAQNQYTGDSDERVREFLGE